MAKDKGFRFTTTRSWPLHYPALHAVSKFGKYQAGFLMDPDSEDAKALTEGVMAYAKELGMGKDDVKGIRKTEDGKLLVNAKSGDQFPPVVENAKGVEIKRDENFPRIWSGSEARGSLVFKAYDTGSSKGITCYLSRVRITKLVEGGEGSFGEPDEGWTGESSQPGQMSASASGDDIPF